MPLTTDPHQRIANADLFNIRFAMYDGDKLVTCEVTSEALQDLAAPDERNDAIEDLFARHRTEVEQYASDLYDEGRLVNGVVRVTNSDIPVRTE
jgi:Protein of unknown function (DUF1488)